MNNIKKFIEDAMKGGYKDEVARDFGLSGKPELILLDPLAWKAVGKTRGWKTGMEVNHKKKKGNHVCGYCTEWLAIWYHFIGSLASGHSIEESLGKIK